MEKQVDNYFMNQLENGRDLNITLISHNSYWVKLALLPKRYKNCNVTTFGSSVSYLEIDRVFNYNKYKRIEDSDLVIMYSSVFYDDNEINYLKDLVSTISNTKNKRVTIGYFYAIKQQDRVLNQVQIISFKNGEYVSEIVQLKHYGVCNIVDVTLALHDECDLESSKVFMKKKNSE